MSWSRFPNPKNCMCIERENRRKMCEWAESHEEPAWTSEFAQSCTSIYTVMSQCQQIWPSCVLSSFPSPPPKTKAFPLLSAAHSCSKHRQRAALEKISPADTITHCALWANRLLSLICAAVDFRECHTETHGLESDTTVGQVAEDCVGLDPEIPSRFLIKRSMKERPFFTSLVAKLGAFKLEGSNLALFWNLESDPAVYNTASITTKMEPHKWKIF